MVVVLACVDRVVQVMNSILNQRTVALPANLSDEYCDLVLAMLDKNPNTRITMRT